MGVGKIFGTHYSDLGSRSLSYRSRTEFNSKVRTANSVATKLGRYILLVMLSARLHCGWILSETFCFINFQNHLYPVKHSICHILGMVGPIDVKQKGNKSTGCCADWGTFDLDLWPWIFKVKLYLGNGRPDYHVTKGMGVDRMPWCETQPLCDLEAEDTVRDWDDLRCRCFHPLI